MGKEKEKKEQYVYLKAHRHGSHSFTCKLHHVCLSFVNVHQMVPTINEVADNCNCSLLLLSQLIHRICVCIKVIAVNMTDIAVAVEDFFSIIVR